MYSSQERHFNSGRNESRAPFGNEFAQFAKSSMQPIIRYHLQTRNDIGRDQKNRWRALLSSIADSERDTICFHISSLSPHISIVSLSHFQS